MSDKDQASADHTPGEEPEILEATVIHETPAPSPEPEPAPRTVKKKTSFAAKAGWGTAALLAAFAGGVYLAPQFAPGLAALGITLAPSPQATRQDPIDLAPLRTELADVKAAFKRQQEILAQHEAALKAAETKATALEGDLATLATAGLGTGDAATAIDPAALAGLQAEINRLTGDVARLSTLSGEAKPEVTQLTGALALARAEVTQLKSRMASVEDAMKAVKAGAIEASPRGRLVLALGRLKDRALVGQPFGADLAALRPDFTALPAIDQQMIGADLGYLEQRGGGIAPYETLVAEFDAVASMAIAAADKAEGGFLSSLFSVRRTDAGATGIDAVMVKAERSLMARDVTGAVTVLESLEGPALEATAAWRSRANDFAGTVQAFDRLTRFVANSRNTVPTLQPEEAGQ